MNESGAGAAAGRGPKLSRLVSSIRVGVGVTALTLALLAILLVSHWLFPRFQVRLELEARAFTCTVGDNREGATLNPELGFQSIEIKRFETVELHPESVEAVSGSLVSPPPAWPASAALTLKAEGKASRVSFSGEGGLGSLDVLRMPRDSRLTIELSRGQPKQLKVGLNQQQELHLPIYREFMVAGYGVDLAGTWAGRLDRRKFELKVRLPEFQQLTIKSRENGLLLALTPAGSSTAEILTRPLPIQRLELTTKENGEEVSALTEDATLEYISYPDLENQAIPKQLLTRIEGIRGAHLELGIVEPSGEGFDLAFEGSAARIVAGNGSPNRDYTPTTWQYVRHSALARALTALVAVIGGLSAMVGFILKVMDLWAKMKLSSESDRPRKETRSEKSGQSPPPRRA